MAGGTRLWRLATVGAACLSSSTAILAPVAAQAGTPILTSLQSNSELAEGYRLASGDKLKITVFDEPTLSGEFAIGVNGDITMPLVDPIRGAGQTSKALAKIIADRLAAGQYVLNPRVSVEVLEHRPFYILGEVNKPGEYPYSGDLTFEQAVALAGGFTPRANKKVILMRREGWASAKRIKLDGPALKVAPGDTITVRESFF
ncbi:MAG: polysaccharide export protein [Sphingomonadales bacterium]|nr:polysaccharide export protein [Sphingomonadales bacterium]